RHLLGEGLGSLNVKELKQLETRLEKGISRIRNRKHEMILAETENLQKREILLEQENALIRAKIQENEKLQELSMMSSGGPELSMMPGGGTELNMMAAAPHDFNFQAAYFARNMNLMMEGAAAYPVPDKK
ncbi:hypothetical protein M569_04104, partial [Genlisea aurea]